jgi:hypothetical protein
MKESPALDRGTAGASARQIYEGRKARRELAIDARWGRLAGIVKFLTDEPNGERSWAKGAAGEEKLGRILDAKLGDSVIGLHDRKVPGTRGNIDHVYVTPNGVWVVDAKNYHGLVETRNVGSLLRPETRLMVDGRDQTRLVFGLDWQFDAISAALGQQTVPLRKALCFTAAEWNLMNPPFTISEVFVTHIRGLRKKLDQPGKLDEKTMVEIAQRLSLALPSK